MLGPRGCDPHQEARIKAIARESSETLAICIGNSGLASKANTKTQAKPIRAADCIQ